MMTIDGICEMLRRYNEQQKIHYSIELRGDTSCDLYCLNTQSYEEYGQQSRSMIHHFGNIYQLLDYFTKHLGVKS